jgi:hypothetical protein
VAGLIERKSDEFAHQLLKASFGTKLDLAPHNRGERFGRSKWHDHFVQIAEQK